MSLWASMTEAERVAHSYRHGNKYHLRPENAGYLEELTGGSLGFGHTSPASEPASTPTRTTGENVVGSDGLTNRERYDARQAAKAAKHAAEQARIAELDSDRPEHVSRYLWERIKGGQGFNSTLVTRNPETRDSLIAAGYGDYVKALTEKEMDGAAAHYMGNGASPEDAYKTAQNSWYNDTYGAYSNSTVQGNAPTLTFGGGTGAPTNEGYVAPVVSQPVASAPVDLSPTYTAKHGGGSGGMLAGYNANRAAAPTSTPVQATSNTTSTPYADAYLRAKGAAEAQGPVSGMMKKWME